MKRQHQKNSPKTTSPRVHDELKGFDIKVNEFGEIESTLPIEAINNFLNRKVVDKKLKNRFGYKSDEDDETIEFLYRSDINE
ncbi:MAG: hypothetical protein AAGJ12_09695 [Bacteroidota bacterium]